MFGTNMHAPIGLQPPSENPVPVFVRGAAMAVGDVLAFDLVRADAAVTNLTPGDPASGWANVRAPTAAEVLGNDPTIFCVCTEAAADDGKGRVLCLGYIDAFVIAAAGSLAIGTDLVVTTAKNFDVVEAAGETIAAIGNQVVTTPTTRTLGNCYVFGYVGMYKTVAA